MREMDVPTERKLKFARLTWSDVHRMIRERGKEFTSSSSSYTRKEKTFFVLCFLSFLSFARWHAIASRGASRCEINFDEMEKMEGEMKIGLALSGKKTEDNWQH
jgi:hypothetical protein